MGAVEWSPDLKRILELPRRPKPDLDVLVAEMTAKLKRPDGNQTLRPHQAWCLWEFPQIGGGMAALAVGKGKTLIAMLLAMVMPGCRVAILFMPPNLIPQFHKEWAEYSAHWKMPNLAGGSTFIPGRPVLHVMPYTKLSDPRSPELLKSINPTHIFGDEGHNWKLKSSVRTRRLLKFCATNVDVSLVLLSGSFTSNSVRNYTHLSALTLGPGSPVPIDNSAVDQWSKALDPDDRGGYLAPGELKRLCEGDEDIRSGYRRRRVDTPGFIATEANEIASSIVFYERRAPEMGLQLAQALKDIRRHPNAGGWKRPDGEILADGLAVSACISQLATGFFYYWHFPRGESLEVRKNWFDRRQDWNREVRARVMRSDAFMDSYALCERAAKRWFFGGCTGCQRGPLEEHADDCSKEYEQPLWESDTYLEWMNTKNTVVYEKRATWLDDYLLKDALEWMKKPGIVWIEHVAFGHRLADLSGAPYYGEGEKAAREVLQEQDRGDRSVIFSFKARHQGLNMQKAFHRNLLINFQSDELIMEQSMGRTHRDGQKADEVEVSYYAHTPELRHDIQVAKNRAKFIFETDGTARKLCYGSWTIGSPDDSGDVVNR